MNEETTGSTLMQIFIKVASIEAKEEQNGKRLDKIEEQLREHSDILNQKEGFSKGTVRIVGLVGGLLGVLATLYAIANAIAHPGAGG